MPNEAGTKWANSAPINRVLISGAAGYLSGFIIEQLKQQYQRTLFDLVEVDTSLPFIQGDIRQMLVEPMGVDIPLSLGASGDWRRGRLCMLRMACCVAMGRTLAESE